MSVSEFSKSYHYKVISRAIGLIDSGDPNQTLDDVASAMNMSVSHFQRLFSAWVGVSPKNYKQYLTLCDAKMLLRQRFTTLEVVNETGLSSGGRLYDLFLKWESMTPGEYATGGVGLRIRWGWFDSPFGPILIMASEKGLCGMAFSGEVGKVKTYEDMVRRWPAATFVHEPDVLTPLVARILGLSNADQPIPLFLVGAPFQIKVWEALLSIPSGRVTTYSEIARALHCPKASRAVGTAVGQNPISWLIPCHRVLRKSGGFGGYHWGVPIKRAMLVYEATRADVAQPD